MNEPKTFWVVWCERMGPPSVKHLTKDAAVKEAKRLAGQNNGLNFFVLESVGFATKVDVDWIPTVKDENAELPF